MLRSKSNNKDRQIRHVCFYKSGITQLKLQLTTTTAVVIRIYFY